MTLRQLRTYFVQSLEGLYPKHEADWLFFLFLERQTGITRTGFFARTEISVDFSGLDNILRRLSAGEPWQYVAGEVQWFDLNIKVDTRVLIPRPETEHLAHIICSEVRNPRRILDIGTGSGCLALALKKCFPRATVTGMDVKDEILQLARQNAKRNGLEVNWTTGDTLKQHFPPGPWDVVVSNPPYVTGDERPSIHRRVKDFEPGLALFVPDGDPVVHYRHIMAFFKEHGSPGARLYFEINPRFTGLLEQIARQHAFHFDFPAYGDDTRFMRIRKSL